MKDPSCACTRRLRCPAHLRTCGECSKITSEQITRGRCNACYKRFRKGAIKAGAFTKVPRVSKPLRDRLLDKVTPGRNGCWIYTGKVGDHGYGYFTVSATERTTAHRISHRVFIGEIPEGFHVDHRCHNEDETCRSGDACIHRRCINPDHLEAVLPKENTRRSPITQASKHAARTHCPQGHEYSTENTSVRVLNARTGRTGRECKACRRQQKAARRGVRR